MQIQLFLNFFLSLLLFAVGDLLEGAIFILVFIPSWSDFNVIKIWSWMGLIIHLKWINQINQMHKLVQPILGQFEPISKPTLN